MTQFKYPHFLLGTVVAGLWFAGEAYATQSLPTLGPSVGHRPLTTDLILANIPGGTSDFSEPNAELWVGDTITLTNPGGVDIDGDENDVGAYCTWYRVATNNIVTVVKHQDGTLNCEYKISSADVGYKIRVDIDLRSDKAKAAAKGYTVNPNKSLIESRISVVPVTKAIVALGVAYNDWHTERVASGGGYPAVVGSKIKFLFSTDSTPLENHNFTFESSEPAVFPINEAGVVIPASRMTTPVTITATHKNTGRVIKYNLRFDQWFVFVEADNYGVAEMACGAEQARLVKKNELTLLNMFRGLYPVPDRKYGIYSPSGGGIIGFQPTASSIKEVKLNYWDRNYYTCLAY